ncbi:transport ATP-binding protein CydD [Klebsiella pneumoniae]|nr:transport ATP-binding protein CydD [Klebsiella pneumoniae]
MPLPAPDDAGGLRTAADRYYYFSINWAAALILLGTAPLIPLFMALVGMGAADANRRNFQALARLSGHFLDRLRGMETLRIFSSRSGRNR